jgi:hypothetical protein
MLPSLNLRYDLASMSDAQLAERLEPLLPAMEQNLRAEFKAWKRMQEEAECREWEARRFTAAA